MLKQVTVNITVDDHEPEKCGDNCTYRMDKYVIGLQVWCSLFDVPLGLSSNRCKQCLEEAK